MDMIYSNSNYSSMAVAARMLANQIMETRTKINEFLAFIVDIVNKMSPSQYPLIGVTLSPYRTVDDMQETGNLIRLAEERRVSWETVLRRFRLNITDELNKIKDEIGKYSSIDEAVAKQNAHILGESNLIQKNYNDLTMIDEMNSQGNTTNQRSVELSAEKIARHLATIYEHDPSFVEEKLKEISSNNPLFASLVEKYMSVLLSDEQPKKVENSELNESIVKGTKPEGDDRVFPPRKL